MGTSLLVLIAALALLPLLLYGASFRRVPVWSVALTVPVIAVSGLWYGKNRDKWLRLIRLRGFYCRGIARIEDRWHSRGLTGEEFRVAHCVYDLDLQILGKDSLFELLCTARTGIGRRRLAGSLLSPAGMAEARSRQEAVRELAPQAELREHVALLGKYEFEESTWEVFSEWIAVPAQTAPVWVRAAMLVTLLPLGGLAFAGLFTNIPWGILIPWMLPIFAFRMSLSWYFLTRTNTLNAAASRIGAEIAVMREGMETIASHTFRSEKLLAIQRRIGHANAVPIIRRLERLTGFLADCDRTWIDYPAKTMNLRTQICLEIEQWKLRHGRRLAEWLDAWGEFEALAAVSGYAWEHQSDTYPEFAEDETEFVARGLGHPLIPLVTCVRNDVAF